MSWVLPRFDCLLAFGGASHVGRVRSNNEDAWCVDPELGLFLVADGMGGHAAGEVASTMVVDAVSGALKTPRAYAAFDRFVAGATLDARAEVFLLLSDAVRHAHRVVTEEGEKNPRLKRMGCTLEAVLLLGSSGFVAHVGDSRVYLSRPTTLIQLTTDHTLKSSLVEGGIATPSAPIQGNALLVNAVGRPGTLRVEEVFVELQPGDRLLLCTDGVTDEIEDEADVSRLARAGRPEEAAIGMINSTLARGARDNSTCVLMEVGGRRGQRSGDDGGLRARDLSFAAHSPLLLGLGTDLVAGALKSAVEVEFEAGEMLPRYSASDRVAYVLLEGSVRTPEGWTLGPSALLYPESLGGGGKGPNTCEAQQAVRAYRIRADDFSEVCSVDPALAAALYERLARHLARVLT